MPFELLSDNFHSLFEEIHPFTGPLAFLVLDILDVFLAEG